MCLRHHNSTRTPVVVSIGSNGDTSFERDVFQTFAAVSHTFDFSLDAPTRARVEALPYIRYAPTPHLGYATVKLPRHRSRLAQCQP